MSAPLLVLRIGYMARYDGPDEIINGGKYVKKMKPEAKFITFTLTKAGATGTRPA